uniref:SoHo domain-containing protein n=1 Tax=Dromaius novaehollandiae TaxID=8790 RepID=A0A8C4JPQ8_DRONO
MLRGCSGDAPRPAPGHSRPGRGGPRAPPAPAQPRIRLPQLPVIRHRGSNTLNFDFHGPAAPRSAGTGSPPRECHRIPPAPRARGGGSAAAPVSPSPAASDWYQTWPAKEAKAPGPTAAVGGTGGPPGCSATWSRDGKRRERRWVKYDGIGPVDETGMPIASRSSVDRPRDWYRSMFQQIHRKLPGEPGPRTPRGPPRPPAPRSAPLSPQSRRWTGTPRAAPPGCPTGWTGERGAGRGGAGAEPSPGLSSSGPRRAGWGDAGTAAEPRSIFDYEPGKSSVLDRPGQVGRPRQGSAPAAAWSVPGGCSRSLAAPQPCQQPVPASLLGASPVPDVPSPFAAPRAPRCRAPAAGPAHRGKRGAPSPALMRRAGLSGPPAAAAAARAGAAAAGAGAAQRGARQGHEGHGEAAAPPRGTRLRPPRRPALRPLALPGAELPSM